MTEHTVEPFEGSTKQQVHRKENLSSSLGDKKKKSVWSDVPRRLTTICIGIPLVWKLLERPATAYLFFFGAHALSAWEYTLLEPAVASRSYVSAHPPAQQDDKKDPSKKATRLFFCITSLLLATIPESLSNLFCFASSLAAGIFCLANKHHWIVGLFIVTFPFRAWCHLALGSNNLEEGDPSSSTSFASTVSVLLTVWNADTGALIAGRLFGRGRKKTSKSNLPEWIQRVSPAKTAEGFLGGIFGGIVTALWAVPILVQTFSIGTTSGFRRLWGLDNETDDSDGYNFAGGAAKRIAIGFVLSVLAIVGDLVESSIKRKSQSKDSGNVLPGHGGILDRFDSSLLAILFYKLVLEQVTTTMVIDDTHIYVATGAGDATEL